MNIICKISYIRDTVRKTTFNWHCLLFAFQLKKNAAEAKEMICSAMSENAASYSTCKKWFQQFRDGNFDLQDGEHPDQKKWKTRSWSKFWMRILAKLNWNLQVSLETQQVSCRLQKLKRIQKESRWIPHKLTPGPTKQKRLWKLSQT